MKHLQKIIPVLVALTGQKLSAQVGEGRISPLPVPFECDESRPVRASAVLKTGPFQLALSCGRWMYIASPDRKDEARGQLSDPESDPGDTEDLATKRPALACELKDRLGMIAGAGRGASLARV